METSNYNYQLQCPRTVNHIIGMGNEVNSKTGLKERKGNGTAISSGISYAYSLCFIDYLFQLTSTQNDAFTFNRVSWNASGCHEIGRSI